METEHPQPSGNDGDAGAETIIIESADRNEPVPAPTVDEAEEAGLDPIEIEAGKKHGLFVEKDPSKNGAKKPDEDPPAPPDKPAAERKRAPAPWEADVPEDERQVVNAYSANEKALYWKQKKEKYRRQQSEAQAAQARAQAEFYRGKVEALEKAKAKPESIDPADPASAEVDEYGDPVTGQPDGDKPLTRADLDRIEREKVEQAKKAEASRAERNQAIIRTLDEQEKAFVEEHEDFGTVYDGYTKAIFEASNDPAKLAQLFPDEIQREGVLKLLHEFALKMREPEKNAGERSAVALAYKIGKAHPKFKAPAHADGGDLEDDDGQRGNEEGDDPDGYEGREKTHLEKRLDKQGRPSSAPLSGGASGRPKSVNDLTMEDLAEMPEPQFEALYKRHRKVIEAILSEAS